MLKIQPLLSELQRWRDELAASSSEVQDKEIWWIFQKQASDDVKPVSSPKSACKKQRHDAEEGFSTSTEDVEHECGEGGSVSTSEADGSDNSECKPLGEAAASKTVRRQYAQRFGSKQPSVRIDRVLRGADFKSCVCHNAALFIFGLGAQRVTRATCFNQVSTKFLEKF